VGEKKGRLMFHPLNIGGDKIQFGKDTGKRIHFVRRLSTVGNPKASAVMWEEKKRHCNVVGTRKENRGLGTENTHVISRLVRIGRKEKFQTGDYIKSRRSDNKEGGGLFVVQLGRVQQYGKGK